MKRPQILPIICLLLNITLIYSSERSWVKESHHDIILRETYNSSKSFCIPSGISTVKISLTETSNSTISVTIPESVKEVTLDIAQLYNSELYLYSKHTLCIKRNYNESYNSHISELHPLRQYTYHGLALATLAVGEWWLSSDKK